jgi:hypothetical protein
MLIDLLKLNILMIKADDRKEEKWQVNGQILSLKMHLEILSEFATSHFARIK